MDWAWYVLVAAAVVGLGGGLLAVGFWAGRNKRIAALEQARAAAEQLEHARAAVARSQQHAAKVSAELDRTRRRLQHNEEQLEKAKVRLYPYYPAYVALKPKFDALKKEYEAEVRRVAALTGDKGQAEKALADLRADLRERERQLDRIERRTRRALKLEGNLWAAKALQARPRFRPLAERRCPILSVLNLKGGVGKTTVAAQLGIALARKGYRVLLVDLDFQGSLTQMLLPAAVQKDLAASRHLVHHFLDLASADPTTKLTDYVQTPRFDLGPGGGKLGLVAASDNLAYTELNLTLRWLLRRGDRDNRFLLRKALHMKGVTRAFDVILLDCPPLVNVSCINALAASDSVLVPVTLSRAVMERVPVLLKRFLRDPRFVGHVNPHLQVAGLVANRTSREQLTAGEREDCKQLATWCRDAYGRDVKQYATSIQQLTAEVRGEVLLTEQKADSKLSRLFAALAAEIERELPNECRRGAATLS